MRNFFNKEASNNEQRTTKNHNAPAGAMPSQSPRLYHGSSEVNTVGSSNDNCARWGEVEVIGDN